MNISPVNNKIKYHNTTFKAYLPNKFYKHAEKCTFVVENLERRAFNRTLEACTKVVEFLKKFMSKFLKDNMDKNKKNLPNLTHLLSPGVVEAIKKNPILHQISIYRFASSMAEKNEIEINIENN